ncbi:MAG: bifunctional 23S rRNA (guanine(2069)-N(7))-methyltransferase RlmK/23S rRNA (guanine(2445)-N(2))-methyltransferase RlmL [Proteobacteria bacterium]|nr:bifunctional 23S rRNA (guanine(2069)-N(7))-methyltransferase RlmK/23S rRNA (guanine(2445)-N(2))-methyltransferase RlmL [Pseudomonadota bacterium]
MATAPRGLADLVARELRELGVARLHELRAGVRFEGELRDGYRACLHSRVASRVLLEVADYTAADTQAFYAGARAIDWSRHLAASGTLACEFTGTHPTITHSQFGALKLKDAICDQLREHSGARPSIALERPDLRVVAHASGARVLLYIDLAGEGLHRRGYRLQAGEAPLRENLAAGMLLRAGWQDIAAGGGAFLDPMCGSGTLPIEAAMIAADIAPGLRRDYWGFARWRGHDARLWRELLEEARARVRAAVPNDIRGSDRDAAVLRNAAANAERAGVAALLTFSTAAACDARPPPGVSGLVCTNPPYGARLGDDAAARAACRELGGVLREHFHGWKAAVLCAADGDAAHELGLRTFRKHELWNGALACQLLRIDLADPGAPAREPGAPRAADIELAASAGAQMFGNRIAKNLRSLGKSARTQGVSNFRLYDADMPEYALAVDRYVEAGSGTAHLYVQEYAAPDSVEPAAANRRRAEALAALPAATQVPREHIHVRVRRRQRGANQYTRVAQQGQYTCVEEGGLKFLVNFTDYLDTGLFLDHRLTRARLRAAAAGRRFLNLFCYTASATVYAVAGGATRSLGIDLSATYLDWAAENFRANGLAREPNELLRADCLEWLREARAASWDLIFLDPPTFSNSKRMSGVLDTQRDHMALLSQCMRLLAPGGLLLFSTNAQRFKLDEAAAQQWQVTDISAATIPFDFQRNPRIHRAFELRAR